MDRQNLLSKVLFATLHMQCIITSRKTKMTCTNYFRKSYKEKKIAKSSRNRNKKEWPIQKNNSSTLQWKPLETNQSTNSSPYQMWTEPYRERRNQSKRRSRVKGNTEESEKEKNQNSRCTSRISGSMREDLNNTLKNHPAIFGCWRSLIWTTSDFSSLWCQSVPLYIIYLNALYFVPFHMMKLGGFLFSFSLTPNTT